MIKNIITTLSLILFIYLPSNIIGQTTGISKEEKKQLEERFKNLKTFYIDDDGLVVYTGGTDNAANDSVKTKVKEDPKSQSSRVKVKVNVTDTGGYVVTQEEANFSLGDHDTILAIPENRYIKDDFATRNDSIESLDIDSLEIEPVIFINKEASIDFNATSEKPVEKPKESVASKDEPQTEDVNGDVTADTKKTSGSLKKRVPTKSADTTLAELEELIGELRAQQSRQNRKNVNSLSNKISGGVDAKIRNEYSRDLSDMSDDSDVTTAQDGNEVEAAKEDPVYYINGVKSTKEEFTKLKPDEIRRKEVRRSKENPSGEWWVQTR